MALTPLRINPPTKGVNTTTPLRELSHDYAVVLDNVWMDKAGAIQARPGQASEIPPYIYPIKKLFEYTAQSGATILFMQDSIGEIHRRSGNTWGAPITTPAGVVKAQIEPGTLLYTGTLGVTQLGSQLIIGDGVNEQYFNGAVWATPTGLANPSINNKCNIFTTHNGRVYGAGSSTFRSVFFASDTLSSGAGTGGAGVADWTIDVAGVNTVGSFIDVSSETGTGDPITGLTSFQGMLVVFTANSIVFYSIPDPNANPSVQKSIHGIGCLNQESIAGIGNNTMFLSKYGFISLREVLVQGDAAAEKSSVAINNTITKELRLGNYQANNVSAVYAQELGVYLCAFGTTVTWAYHELFGGWMPWYGLPAKLLVSTTNKLYGATTELISISSNNSQDVLSAGNNPINFTWQPAPFRSSGAEIKARWNRVELVYESLINASITFSSWLNLDESNTSVVSAIPLNPSSVVTNPLGMIWSSVNSADPRTKWGSTGAGSKWAGTRAGTGILLSGTEPIPIAGRSELISFSISNAGLEELRISALEVYRNDGGLR